MINKTFALTKYVPQCVSNCLLSTLFPAKELMMKLKKNTPVIMLCSIPMFIFCVASSVGRAEEKEEVLPGHSLHGHSFDTGPRQSATLMGGTGNVHLPISSKNPQVQKFIDQGLGQLHGFWFFEAERSFRQAAAIEPDCAIAYWGMAMANESNEKRAKDFITKAHELKDYANQYEQKWIQALHNAYHKKYKDEKARWQTYISALEDLVHEYPEDVEPKAMLALHLFWNKSGKALGVTSREAIDALLGQVFAINPMHPAHHYRIHLWDTNKPKRALKSAALCGQAAPSIAHMWHMSGHIFSRVKRYEDACWQQEASSRVDHFHMVRDHVLPTEIHNYTHNQEWFTRNLIKVGRIRDALAIAKNLVELPRHPRHNSPSKNGSAVVRGRTRLLDVLIQFELWDELLELAQTPYLAVDDEKYAHIRKVRYLAVANFSQGNCVSGKKQLTILEKMLAEQKGNIEAGKCAEEAKTSEIKNEVDNKGKNIEKSNKPTEAEKKESEKARLEAKKKKREIEALIKKIEKAIAHVQGERAVLSAEHAKALELFKKAGDLPKTVMARTLLNAGKKQEAEDLARKAVDSARNEVYPLAFYAKLLHQLNKPAESKKAFEQMRELSALIDIDLSIFREMEPLAKEFGYSENWLREYKHREDSGIRPPIESLGPLTWHTSQAPAWSLKDSLGKSVSLSDYQGKPVVVIFYLGFGCLHCVEQLGVFSPMTKEYNQAGIEIVAIGSDNLNALKDAVLAYKQEKTLNFPVLTDDKLDIFEKYRCVDNFENQALHGTFLIDSKGQIRWQDIGPEPFTDAEFLLKESTRLLNLSPTKNGVTPGVASSDNE